KKCRVVLHLYGNDVCVQAFHIFTQPSVCLGVFEKELRSRERLATLGPWKINRFKGISDDIVTSVSLLRGVEYSGPRWAERPPVCRRRRRVAFCYGSHVDASLARCLDGE